MGLWQTIRSSIYRRHSHPHAYAALVLSGAYEEAGDHGRFNVQASEVLLHDRFSSHSNRFPASGAVVLNLPLPAHSPFLPGTAKVPDPDAIVRLAQRSRMEAARALLSNLSIEPARTLDWPDELAAALIHNPSLCLSRWSRDKGLKPWAVSRGFLQVFELSPSAFRARARARLAWKTISASDRPLAQIAAESGFADQAHMTRSVKKLTGQPPRAWRLCK